MASSMRYKPVIRQEGNMFWKKYAAKRQQRETELKQKLTPPTPIVETKKPIAEKPKKKVYKNTSKRKPESDVEYSSDEEVVKKPVRKRKSTSEEEGPERAAKTSKRDGKRKLTYESEDETPVTPVKKSRPIITVKRAKKATLFDEDEKIVKKEKKTVVKEDKPKTENKQLSDQELFTQAKEFCQTYQQTQPGNSLLQYAQKKNIRAVSQCLSKIVHKDKFLFHLLTAEEKSTLRNNHENLVKIIDSDTTDTDKRKHLLQNPELTNLITNFLSSLEIYNEDGKENKEMEAW